MSGSRRANFTPEQIAQNRMSAKNLLGNFVRNTGGSLIDTITLGATDLDKKGDSGFQTGAKNFLGKDALKNVSIRSKCVTILLEGPKDADPWGREAIFHNNKKIGRLTSGGYSVHFKCSIAMGYVSPELAKIGQKVKVKMFDKLWDAKIVEDSPYDPKNEKIKLDG